ncbi:hypothetical protein [Shewanella algidipiscicola]|uniref:Deacetylase sirtuin-type domain-containing protein n=1 Tax=Shewanella algidipiscicola TaxID=614070 RepID=A0ABQ4PJ65_9GAMM|nr:hypothetical protein [Shewanella algidipiscicola]GIU47622.1 hypothetical protein TUM4630_22030 [Shewanella algidipiscicola]
MALPALDVSENKNNSPHVVILGAGASFAAFPNGDKNGRKLPLMYNLVEVLGIGYLFEKHGVKYDGDNFEAVYDQLSKSGQHEELVQEIETAVEEYFRDMELPDEPTIYDYLILSHRPKDIIATFNWDPFLAQAYQRNMRAVGFENMPRIVFLHGSVSIGACMPCKTKGWVYNRCDSCGKQFTPSKLLYPVSDKNYSAAPLLFGEWDELQRHVKHAYFVTVFGYSAPVTDAEARKLLLDVWQENQVKDFALIEVIDIKSSEEVKASWADFIVRENYAIYNDFFNSYAAVHPRRSCDAYAMATLQQSPWQDNPFVKGQTLKELQEWTLNLVEEEQGVLSSKGVTK